MSNDLDFLVAALEYDIKVWQASEIED